MFYSFIDLDNNSYENSYTDNKFSDNLLPLPCLLFKNNIFVDTDNLNSAFNENDKGINLEGSHSESEQSFINKLDLCKIIEEKSTAVTNNQIPMNQNKKDNLKKYTFNDIKQILKDKDFEKYKEIIDNSKDEPKLKVAENNKIINKKKEKSCNLNNQENKIYIKYGYGRKKKEDTSSRIHTEYTPDNIIKKIKGKFIDYLIKFVNNMIINKAKAKGKRYKILKKLNCKKYINIMNKDSNLNFLEKPVKEILSDEISPKYSKYLFNWNEKIIESILEKYKEDKNIIFALKMKFIDWIDIFLLKKSIKNYGYLNEKECEEFEDCLPKINILFEKILKEKDKQYLPHFIFYCYNYEAWFKNKTGRSIKKKK